MPVTNGSVIFSLCLSILILSIFLVLHNEAYGAASENKKPYYYPCVLPTTQDYSTTAVAPSTGVSSKQDNFVQAITSNTTLQMGSMDENQILNMTIVLNMRNQSQLEKCLDSINNSTHPNYHHFLNNTMILPYVITPGEKSSVKSFLQGKGFQVQDGSSPLVLMASAPVGKVEDAFVVQIKTYQVPTFPNSNTCYPSSAVSKFSDLAIGTSKISNLCYNNYGNIQPMIFTPSTSGIFYAPSSAPMLPSNISDLVGHIGGLDNYTVASPLQYPCTGPYCPDTIQAAYSFTKLYQNGFNGSGTNVAIVGCAGDPNPKLAMQVYENKFNLTRTQLHVYYYPDDGPPDYDPSWAGETMMDVQAVHSIAPGANIHLVYVNCALGGPMDGIDYVANHHIANIVSNSWSLTCGDGPCSDTQLSPSLVASTHNRLTIDASLGSTILFASGDNGATPDLIKNGTEFPASDPNVLAVGATTISSHVSGKVVGPNVSFDYIESGSKISGGGYSGYFKEPSWQTAVIGQKSGRSVPDVSMLGAAPAFWVYSTSSNQCGSSHNSTEGWFVCSGTSLATPLWAGYLAILEQKNNFTSFGNVAPYLYSSYKNTNGTSFNDIVLGDNNLVGNGYSAQSGWDPVTGLGTPKVETISTVPEFPLTPIIVMLLAFFALMLMKHINSFKK